MVAEKGSPRTNVDGAMDVTCIGFAASTDRVNEFDVAEGVATLTDRTPGEVSMAVVIVIGTLPPVAVPEITAETPEPETVTPAAAERLVPRIAPVTTVPRK